MPGAPEKTDSCKHSEILGEGLGQEASRHSQNSNLSAQGVLFHPRTHWILQKGLGMSEDNLNNVNTFIFHSLS